MIPKKVKTSLVSICLAASLLVPAKAIAKPEIEHFNNAPKITQTIINNDTKTRLAILGINLTVSCLKGGIGAATRKESFLKGCVKALPGGAVTSLGENLVSYNYIPGVGALAKLTNDLGESGTDNIMNGRKFFAQFQTDFGPLNFTFKGSYLPKIKVNLTSLVGIGRAIYDRGDFDPKNTLYNLTLTFVTDKKINASTIGNVISYSTKSPKDLRKTILSHEQAHTLSWRGFRFLGNLGGIIPGTKKIGEYVEFGPDIVRNSFFLPGLIDKEWSYHSPLELKAYALQRH